MVHGVVVLTVRWPRRFLPPLLVPPPSPVSSPVCSRGPGNEAPATSTVAVLSFFSSFKLPFPFLFFGATQIAEQGDPGAHARFVVRFLFLFFF